MAFAVLTVGSLLLISPRSTAAQELIDSAGAAAVARLRTGSHVRVTWPDGAGLSGRLTRRTSDSLIISVGAAARPVALADVAAVWEACGRATAPGARLGAVTMGAAGGVFGLLFGGLWCESECGRARAAGAATGLASGITLGAFAGGAIGSLFPRWHRLFP